MWTQQAFLSLCCRWLRAKANAAHDFLKERMRLASSKNHTTSLTIHSECLNMASGIPVHGGLVSPFSVNTPLVSELLNYSPWYLDMAMEHSPSFQFTYQWWMFHCQVCLPKGLRNYLCCYIVTYFWCFGIHFTQRSLTVWCCSLCTVLQSVQAHWCGGKQDF